MITAHSSRPEPAKPSSLRQRIRSAIWATALIPMVLLPYRWLWVICAMAASLLALTPAGQLRQRLRQDGTIILGTVAALILRTALDPGWWAPWLVLMIGLYVCVSRTWWTRKRGVAAAVAAWPLALALLARPSISDFASVPVEAVDPDTVLVCAGDSLTSGLGTRTDDDTYVARLRDRLGCRVINAGFPGDRAHDLLKRLDKDVMSHKPTVALLFIGGNDYFDGTPRSQLAADMEALVSRITTAGHRLVLVETPSGVVWNSYAGVHRRLANRYGAVLVPDSRLRCWFTAELLFRDRLANPLTIDGIHLSPHGASRVADWLAPYIAQAAGYR